MKNFEELPKKEYTEYTEFIKEMNSAFAGELAIRFNNETIMITSFSLDWINVYGHAGYAGRESCEINKQKICYPVLLMSFIFDGKIETLTLCPNLKTEMFDRLYDDLSSDIENFKNEQQKK